MNRKILLWDVDGTLVSSNGGATKAFERGVEAVFGKPFSLEQVDFRGRTDRLIAENVLKHLGQPSTPQAVEELLETYLGSLAEELAGRATRLFPGIGEILKEGAQRKGIVMGLLTGNLKRGAELKLRHGGIWDYFEFGAFADDSADRNQLGLFALERAEKLLGEKIAADAVFVIGDTPHDIACGKAFGARTIAVATGFFSEEELAQHNPTGVFQDFSDTERFWEVVEAETTYSPA